MKALQWFKELNQVLQLVSSEGKGKDGQLKKASNSELQRMLEQGAVLINGERVDPKEEIDFPIFSVVLYPKSEKKRCTLL